MKTVEFLLMADRLALTINNKIDRIYKIDSQFREGIVADMKFNDFEPGVTTLAAFPWLREHFMGEFARLVKCGGCGDLVLSESFIDDDLDDLVVVCGGCGYRSIVSERAVS